MVVVIALPHSTAAASRACGVMPQDKAEPKARRRAPIIGRMSLLRSLRDRGHFAARSGDSASESCPKANKFRGHVGIPLAPVREGRVRCFGRAAEACAAAN